MRAAQRGVPTGIVYKNNEERLTAVGTGMCFECIRAFHLCFIAFMIFFFVETLKRMLYDRNWEGLPAHTAHAKALRSAAENAAAKTVAAAAGAAAAAAVNPSSSTFSSSVADVMILFLHSSLFT